MPGAMPKCVHHRLRLDSCAAFVNKMYAVTNFRATSIELWKLPDFKPATPF